MTLAVVACSVGFTASSSADTPAPTPPPFTAMYSLEWHGITAGYTTLELKQEGSNEFVYTSSSVARGPVKLFFPRPIVQESHFKIVGDQVIPSRYHADDGSGKPDKTVDLQFDWQKMRVTGTSEGKPVDVELHPGTEDDMSVQIALMLDLKSGHVPSSFWLINKDEVQEYQYTKEGEQELETPVGTQKTIIYKSHHEGSSRTTLLWLAPPLDFMPVRGEQSRNDKTEFAMNIKSFKH